MVLESLISADSLLRKPAIMLPVGFLYASIGIALGTWVFREHASLVSVFLIAFGFFPLFIALSFMQDSKQYDESRALRNYLHSVWSFIFIFVGISVACAVWFVASPNTFSVQTQTIASLNQVVTGNAVSISAYPVILLNNLKVLLFCVLFSFVYGAGSMFILSWNASVIGTAIGAFFNKTSITGMATLASGSMSLLRYFTHGIPEVAGYFIGGLAGSLLSVAIIRKEYSDKELDRVMLDASNLLLVAIFVLVLAGIIETVITPMIIS